MITLPLDCYDIIFNNLRHNYKNLYSCALVNRQWCRIIIPILWSEPKNHFKNIKLIRTFLLTLNSEEQALLIPFKITLPSYPRPLFEYTSYITSIEEHLYDGIRKWIHYERDKTVLELENVVKYSLIRMFLRTSKNLKSLILDNKTICNQIIFENLYENTTITSIILYYTCIDLNFKTIDILIQILHKNSTLTSLDLNLQGYRFFSNIESEREALIDALCKNNTLKKLNIYHAPPGSKEGALGE
ncbi:f-box domain-containing protein [Gigaspora margarita]|uniref:F-box domain-containing protein n=1 Tax=Gigaspora margarita TaxID=4874 RepID=A0A8H4AR01_GIGMA|nr:f-box domain-containing protein [Gigaspora margarita]